jgi:hypothetical protein
VLAGSATADTPAHVSVYGASAFVSSTGVGGLPASCFASHPCKIATTVTSGRTVLASTGPEAMAANGGGLLYFTLSRAARATLARKHRLAVTVTARDASGTTTSAPVTLVSFATSGSGPKRGVAQPGALQFIGMTDFVNRAGVGGILAGCFAASPCRISTTVRAGATTIATTGPEYLGTNELGYLIFTLTSAGRALLSHAAGNQLAAQVAISAGASSAQAHLALVGFR